MPAQAPEASCIGVGSHLLVAGRRRVVNPPEVPEVTVIYGYGVFQFFPLACLRRLGSDMSGRDIALYGFFSLG